MRTLVAVAVLVMVAAASFAQGGGYAAPEGSSQAFRVKAGYADVGDLGGAFTAAIEYSTPEFVVTAGWADAKGTLRSGLNVFEFDGDQYFLEAGYTYRPPSNPLTYIGLGAGWYRLDGDFQQTQPVPGVSSGHDDSAGAFVVVGTESGDRRWFCEVRWVVGTDHWDWTADGLRAYVGMRF